MVLKLGSSGGSVRQLQEFLRLHSYLVLKTPKGGSTLTGFFGELTEAAVKSYQRLNGLTADGIVGPLTWAKMFPSESLPSPSAEYDYIPYQSELTSLFGAPTSAKAKSYLTTLDFRAINGLRFIGHRWMYEPLTNAFTEIADMGLDILTFDGCYCVRTMTGGGGWSVHSWGLAIDLEAGTNGYGKRPKMDKRKVAAFARAGLEWGGLWSTPDGMHFQLPWTRDWTIKAKTEYTPAYEE